MDYTILLIRGQKLSAILFVVGNVLLVISSSLEEIEEFEKNKGRNVKFNSTPTQIYFFSFGTILNIGAIIQLVVAQKRLDQLIDMKRRGKKTLSIGPYYWIIAGAWFILIGVWAIAVGSWQRVREEANIEIV